MNLKSLEKLIAVMPEGEGKKQLYAKLHAYKKKVNEKPDGLHDEFHMKPEGHIQIEAINSEGEVVGVLADQKNLVVDGSEEILLRAFSGDPARILYKNRVPKNGISHTYHAPLNEILSVENEKNIITHHPNELWKVVNDDDFEIEYAYYPNTLYVKEEVSTEPNLKAFSIHSEQNTNTAPLTAEIYSTFSNLFIGLGDGENYAINLNDDRLQYEGFSGDGVKQASEVNSLLSFKEKISNFVVEYNEHNKGGKLGVHIDGVLVDTIDTYNSELQDEEVLKKSKRFNVQDHQTETEVDLEFTGLNDELSVGNLQIAGIKFDAFSKDMNGLIHEFENHTNKFHTPTAYNTTSVAPYTIKLEHAPAKKETIKVTYNEIELEEVEQLDQVIEGKYYVDYYHGLIYFNRAMTGLMVSFETTGQIMEHKKATNLDAKDAFVTITDETPIGDVDGSNKVFNLVHGDVTEVSKVLLNGAEVPAGTSAGQYRLNISNGTVTFNTAPDEGSEIKVDYIFKKQVLAFTAEYKIDENKEVILFDQNFKELTKGGDTNAFVNDGVFVIDTTDNTNKTILIAQKDDVGEQIRDLELFYYSDEKPGVPTNYTRQVVLKPKEVNQYPWYALDKGSIQFVAEFAEDVPNSSITVREMGLFDGPRMDDQIKGFPGYPVKAFSLVRVGEARKDTATGLRVTWTITLTNENGEPFKGGL
ncbi:hypothetical protein [Oceanobacillus profundus]|uniref:Uncharacterized protein n=1 Tax=Oceanobacillus profundus TaxID=372463 RepID=A0A417YGU2_9BACI|nr:hypothetical protein [Oceanobacillus profundus]RHW31984.1 hypothetical protein D1B32_12160 [Oceanobacillus profundus]